MHIKEHKNPHACIAAKVVATMVKNFHDKNPEQMCCGVMFVYKGRFTFITYANDDATKKELSYAFRNELVDFEKPGPGEVFDSLFTDRKN